VSGSLADDFDAWYERVAPAVIASLAVVVGDRELAREGTADAFLKALVDWERVRVMDNPQAWVFKVALNLTRRAARRAARERESWRRAATGRPLAVADPADGDVWRLVAQLPYRTRLAMVLRYVADWTEPEIASAMGVTRGTVATLIHRGRQQLGAQLAQPLETQP
jgi:RNA polymerase sigma-70 factor (ECF subfamily)